LINARILHGFRVQVWIVARYPCGNIGVALVVLIVILIVVLIVVFIVVLIGVLIVILIVVLGGWVIGRRFLRRRRRFHLAA